jgi:hypothetical protein
LAPSCRINHFQKSNFDCSDRKTFLRSIFEVKFERENRRNRRTTFLVILCITIWLVHSQSNQFQIKFPNIDLEKTLWVYSMLVKTLVQAQNKKCQVFEWENYRNNPAGFGVHVGGEMMVGYIILKVHQLNSNLIG